MKYHNIIEAFRFGTVSDIVDNIMENGLYFNESIYNTGLSVNKTQYFLENLLMGMEFKKLGIVQKNDSRQLLSFNDYQVDSKYEILKYLLKEDKSRTREEFENFLVVMKIMN